MIELGKRQLLTVVREKEFGVYLAEDPKDETAVLLPGKQVPAGTRAGDRLEVFIYRDSEDRLIATTREPKLQVGETAVLTVKETGKIGAFLDMGLEKDVLLPFKEQTERVRPGQQCLAALYVDKSGRLAATMKVHPYLNGDSPYEKDDRVSGMVYEVSPQIGAFVAVDGRYYGLIPAKEFFGNVRPGDTVQARVTKVRDDGKLDLSLNEKAHIQMNTDAETVMEALEARGGVLPFTDKADPEIIRQEFAMSKNAFKRAVGHLLKEGRVRITGKTIEKVSEAVVDPVAYYNK